MRPKMQPIIERKQRIDLRKPKHLCVLVGQTVVALEPLTGDEIWRSRLPGVFGGPVGTLLIDGDMVFAGNHGRLHCLSLDDGRHLWTAELKGLGWGMVSIAIDGANAAMAMQSPAAIAHMASS